MSFRIAVAAAGWLCVAAQVAAPQAIIENDQLRVELIGLKRWTIPMIQDSLRRYSPKDSLLSHACAAVLRDKLKFADASVMYYETTIAGKQLKPYLAVTVVEPQDSALIRYRAPFRDSLPARRAWAPVLAVFEKNNRAFQRAIRTPAFMPGNTPLAEADSALRTALPLRRFLRDHRSPRDMRLALTTLASDGNWQNRVVAVVLLANFLNRDAAWRALAETLRDPNAPVSATAAQLLGASRVNASRPVDWAPAIETIRAILDGTNLFAHNEMMETLASTRVNPALARPLLAGGGHIVLAKLRSQGTAERQAARHFLVQVAGRDLGEDPAVWEDWVRSL